MSKMKNGPALRSIGEPRTAACAPLRPHAAQKQDEGATEWRRLLGSLAVCAEFDRAAAHHECCDQTLTNQQTTLSYAYSAILFFAARIP